MKEKQSSPIPEIGYGTWKLPKTQTAEAIFSALKVGYRHIDSAFAYGNHIEVGEGIQNFLAKNPSVKRSDLFIVSKLWSTQHHNVLNACKKALEELKLDYLDCYMIHWPFLFEPLGSEEDNISSNHSEEKIFSLKYPINEKGTLNIKPFTFEHLKTLWKEMEKLVELGLVKHLGVSNFNIDLIKEILSYCKIKPICNQIECHPLLQQKEQKEFLDKENIKIVAYSPLAGGIKELFENENIVEISKRLNVNKAQTILLWNLRRGVIVIPKGLNEEQIRENYEVVGLIDKTKNKEISDLFEKMEKEMKEKRTLYPKLIVKDGKFEVDYDFKF